MGQEESTTTSSSAAASRGPASRSGRSSPSLLALSGGSFGAALMADMPTLEELEEAEFESLPISSWGKDDIDAWLRRIGCESIATAVCSRVGTGTELIGFDLADPIFGTISDEKVSLTLRSHVAHLQHLSTKCSPPRKFDMCFHRCYQKIVELGEIPTLMQGSECYRFMAARANILSDARAYRGQLYVRRKRAAAAPAAPGAAGGQQQQQQQPTLPVRILLVESDCDWRDQMDAKIVKPHVEPVLSPVSMTADFGRFSVAVAVGGTTESEGSYLFRWSPTGLVLPVNLTHKSNRWSIFLTDVDPFVLHSTLSFGEAMGQIAWIAARWNGLYKYARMAMRGEQKEGNSMDFVLEVCKALGVGDGLFPLHVDAYFWLLRRIRARGETEGPDFMTESAEFIETFRVKDWPLFAEVSGWAEASSSSSTGLGGSLRRSTGRGASLRKGAAADSSSSSSVKLRFRTHQQLDAFLWWCYENGGGEESKFPNEFRVLRTFDRAFWLRAHKEPQNERWQAAPATPGREFGQSPWKTGCRFGDPRSGDVSWYC